MGPGYGYGNWLWKMDMHDRTRPCTCTAYPPPQYPQGLIIWATQSTEQRAQQQQRLASAAAARLALGGGGFLTRVRAYACVRCIVGLCGATSALPVIRETARLLVGYGLER
jgi:hypothetical protein